MNRKTPEPMTIPATQCLFDRLEQADPDSSCTCNIAEHSPIPFEHDQYCAYRLLQEASDQIDGLRSTLQAIANNTCCDRCQEAALVAKKYLELDNFLEIHR